MAQGRAHARQQLFHAERLGDVVVGAEIERLHLAGLVAAARQHDDRHAFVAAADHAQQIMAVDVGQAEIEDDQRGILGELLQRDLAVGGFEDFIALRAQSHPQQLSDRGFVVDDQDLDGGSVHAAVSSILIRGIGSRIVMTAPLRSVRLPAEIVPCIASTKPREMARPRPYPAAHDRLFARDRICRTRFRVHQAECRGPHRGSAGR